MKNGFFRGHGLGNDYLVMDPLELTFKLSVGKIRGICDRHWGVGSDGILALVPSKKADFGLRIFNPDGSEAEKSGNGLRIFARYLHATGKTKKNNLPSRPRAAWSPCRSTSIGTAMPPRPPWRWGEPLFTHALPCTLPMDELIQFLSKRQDNRSNSRVSASAIPIACSSKKPARPRAVKTCLLLGPALGNHPFFPKRTNVQLAIPTGSKAIFILIWERGAGETQASGSSSCAAASAAVRLGLVKGPVTVNMPGGSLNIEVAPDFSLTMKGPVEEVARGSLSPSFVRTLR